jgi:hypothetical protein
MNTQILPNWFKKIALIIFIISSIISGGDDFIAGWNEGYNAARDCQDLKSSYENSNHNNYYITNLVGGIEITHWIGVLASFALLTYMFSKEEIEDDYIKLLRLESFQLSFIILTIIALIFYIFNRKLFFGLDDSVNLFMFVYLTIFFFKKRII